MIRQRPENRGCSDLFRSARDAGVAQIAVAMQIAHPLVTIEADCAGDLVRIEAAAVVLHRLDHAMPLAAGARSDTRRSSTCFSGWEIIACSCVCASTDGRNPTAQPARSVSDCR